MSHARRHNPVDDAAVVTGDPLDEVPNLVLEFRTGRDEARVLDASARMISDHHLDVPRPPRVLIVGPPGRSRPR